MWCRWPIELSSCGPELLICSTRTGLKTYEYLVLCLIFQVFIDYVVKNNTTMKLFDLLFHANTTTTTSTADNKALLSSYSLCCAVCQRGGGISLIQQTQNNSYVISEKLVKSPYCCYRCWCCWSLQIVNYPAWREIKIVYKTTTYLPTLDIVTCI